MSKNSNDGKQKQKEREEVSYERFNAETAEAYAVKQEMLLSSWLSLGEAKYGKDMINWKFRCPKCGRVNSGRDFINHNTEVDKAYTNCIGNFNNRIGCSWKSGGFFGTLGKGYVLHTPEHVKLEVFPFAD